MEARWPVKAYHLPEDFVIEAPVDSVTTKANSLQKDKKSTCDYLGIKKTLRIIWVKYLQIYYTR